MAQELGAPGPRFAMRGIRKAFGATLALDGVDLAVRAGEVCALVGQNGAGKSTLMGILAGALAPDAGEMRLDGEPFRPRRPQEGRGAGVAMIYQERSLAPHLPVAENIVLGTEPTRLGLLRGEEMRERARRALEQLQHADMPLQAVVGTLSLAEQQLVEIARALAGSCRILVLDEPTSSLGREDVQRLFALIARLKGQGQAIVYISHFLEEVKEVADRFVVLRDGKNAGGGETAPVSAREIGGMMVGRPVDDLFPRSPRPAGEVALALEVFGKNGATLTLRRGGGVGVGGRAGGRRTRAP